jgi:hypothetical protein
MRLFVLPLAFVLALSTPAQAATFNEVDIDQGFSTDYLSPTAIGAGYDTVEGTLSTTGYEFLSFTDLSPGAQTVSLTFDMVLPAGTNSYQQQAGYVRFSEDAFENSPEEGERSSFRLVYNPNNTRQTVLSQTLSFDLDSSFTGSSIFFSLRMTNSSLGALSFGVAVPGNSVGASPVPIPAAGFLLLAVLGGMFGFRKRGPAQKVACVT